MSVGMLSRAVGCLGQEEERCHNWLVDKVDQKGKGKDVFCFLVFVLSEPKVFYASRRHWNRGFFFLQTWKFTTGDVYLLPNPHTPDSPPFAMD